MPNGSVANIGVSSVKLDTAVLDKITSEIKPKAGKVVNKYGLLMMGSWASDVRVDTSAFRNSILSESKMIDEMLFALQDGVEYGIWNELGTSKMAARPSLVSAIEYWSAKFLSAFSGLFK
jgi:hypothetical protein